MATEVRLLINWWTFMDHHVLWSGVAERLDEPNDNPEQRHGAIFYKRNGFKTSNAFLEYEGLSFEILYRGDHFDEKAYRDIFHKLQENAYFDFSIKHRRRSDL